MRKKNPTPAPTTPTPKPADNIRSAMVQSQTAKPAPTPSNGTISEETIRSHAYRKWEAAGRPDGDGLQFWLDAEKELSQSPASGA
jgi:hypothetical protein